MSQRFIVRAPDRTGQGHDATWTPGRRWPGGKEIEVEVLDQDECPTITERIHPDSEEKRTFVHPTQIGRKAWDRIRNDKLLTVRPVGDTPAEAETLQTSLSETKAKLEAALEQVSSYEARAGMAEREVVKLGKALEASEASVDSLHAVVKAAQDKVAELELQLEDLTAPTKNTQAESAPVQSAAAVAVVKQQGKGTSKREG